MSFEWLSDPTAWLGLGTLVVLEIVLGIDNLVFIAILADKLPPNQRKRARMIGLSLALFMRLALLASISWVVSLTRPLFTIFGMGLSGRDLILLGGGIFLLFKATMELHERLEGGHAHETSKIVHPAFWTIIVQIMLLDIVFSLDSVITAVGMVDELSLMMIAVLIAVIVMMTASGPLMNFVSAHPTVVILCLSFLLMIGFSLVVEGLGFHLPKGYLYAAIGFSVLIEALNQVATRNRSKRLAAAGLQNAQLSLDGVALAVQSSASSLHPGKPRKHSDGFLNAVQEASPRVREIDIAQTRERLAQNPNAKLIDVREESEWAKGHAAHAMHVGKGVIERDIEEAVPDKSTEVILYCGGGYRSILAADALQKMGYTNVASMAGGWRAWRDGGHPTES